MIKQLGWMGFKITETFLGFFVLAYHFKGFLAVERGSEMVFYLGIFVSFPLVNMLSSINICFGHPPSLAIEATIAILATVCYVMASIFTMYTAEKDFYMIYLSPKDGATVYPFFFYSKAQSISSLVIGVLYMLHGFLLVDAMCYDIRVYEHGGIEDPAVVGKPLELYCFGRHVHMMIDRIDGYKPPRRRRYTEDAGSTEDQA